MKLVFFWETTSRNVILGTLMRIIIIPLIAALKAMERGRKEEKMEDMTSLSKQTFLTILFKLKSV